MAVQLNQAPRPLVNCFLPVSITDALNFVELFGRRAPVEVDLGCGDGTFLSAYAAENPERNFLGIERAHSRLERARRKIRRLELANVHLLGIESSYAVAHLIRPESVSAFHLLFPDPWPKRRHHGRRVFTREFLQGIFRALEKNGLFQMATDDADYFGAMRRMLLEERLFGASETPIRFPRTTFEQRFLGRGVPIYRLLLRKVSPVR